MNKIFFGMIAIALATCARLVAASPQASVADASAPPAVVDSPAAIIFGSCPQRPLWPEAARNEKRQGIVVVAFHVDADSTVVESKVKRSSGHTDLDEAARVGLEKCKFRAAIRNGAPVREWMQLNYNWVP